MPRSARRLVLPALVALYTLGLFSAAAFLTDGLFERDGYYHARLARMMPSRGLSRQFPWTQLSTWRDRFCDKELLYHALMAPLAQLGREPLRGVQVFATLLSLAVLAALYWVLRRHGARWPLFFAALPLAMGGLFLARLTMIRSHVLSMLLLLLGLHLLLERRWRALVVLGFVYAWSYTMPFVLLMTAVPFALGRWVAGGGLDWRSVLAAGAGAVLGLALHPYTPLTLETFLTYVEVFTIGMKGIGATGFELGNEIYPYPLPVLFNIYPLLLISVPLLPLAAWLRRRQLSAEAAGCVLAALFWFGMTLASARFAEYSVLLIALAWALVVRDWRPGEADGPPLLRRLLASARIRALLAGAAVAALVGFHVYALDFYVHYRTKAAPPRFFTGAAGWMARNLARGETVINLFWDDFPDLFYDGYRQRYLWGLDPTYSIRDDPRAATWLERFRRRKVPLFGPTLRVLFRSRYLVLRASRAGRYPELRGHGFTEVYRDDAAVIYRIES